jgi:hypothetical protein
MCRTDLMSHAQRSAQSSALVQARIAHAAAVQIVLPAGNARCALGRLIPTHADFTRFPDDRKHQDARNRADLRTLSGTEHIRRRAA